MTLLPARPRPAAGRAARLARASHAPRCAARGAPSGVARPRRKRAGGGSRSTSCSISSSCWPVPARWPSAQRSGVALRGRAASSRRGSRESLPWTLTGDQQQRAARDHGRHDRAGANAPAPHGRCRHRQDGGGALRHAARDRERLPGRAHGAHRAAGRAARGDARSPARAARHPAGAAARTTDARPRRRRLAQAIASGAARLTVGTHALVQESDGVPAARARRDRRAAPLRRGAARGAGREGRGTRCPPADRHADPALAGAHALRRPRCLDPA